MSQPSKTATEAVTEYFQAQSQQSGVVNALYSSLVQALTTVEQQRAALDEKDQVIAALKAAAEGKKK